MQKVQVANCIERLTEDVYCIFYDSLEIGQAQKEQFTIVLKF